MAGDYYIQVRTNVPIGGTAADLTGSYQPPDAAACVALRRLGHLSRTFAMHRSRPRDLCDRDGSFGRPLDPDLTVCELQVLTIDLQLKR